MSCILFIFSSVLYVYPCAIFSHCNHPYCLNTKADSICVALDEQKYDSQKFMMFILNKRKYKRLSFTESLFQKEP